MNKKILIILLLVLFAIFFVFLINTKSNSLDLNKDTEKDVLNSVEKDIINDKDIVSEINNNDNLEKEVPLNNGVSKSGSSLLIKESSIKINNNVEEKVIDENKSVLEGNVEADVSADDKSFEAPLVKEVIVTKIHKSNSIYKYVYTPSRYYSDKEKSSNLDK